MKVTDNLRKIAIVSTTLLLIVFLSFLFKISFLHLDYVNYDENKGMIVCGVYKIEVSPSIDLNDGVTVVTDKEIVDKIMDYLNTIPFYSVKESYTYDEGDYTLALMNSSGQYLLHIKVSDGGYVYSGIDCHLYKSCWDVDVISDLRNIINNRN